jgi:hypothetical protein
MTMAIMAARGNQGLGKWESAASMVRLVRELVERLEEAGAITGEEITQTDNVLYPFLATLPKKVQEDVRHG